MHDLARHMAWADATVWASVLATPQAEGDAKIGDTLHHLHVVQHIFLQAWTKAAPAVRERKEFASLADMAAWALAGRRGIVAYVEGASEEELEHPLRMPWAAYFEQATKQTAGVHTLGESVLQVFLHTQHHRGQVCARLREIGGAPPTIDFIVWLWGGRPSESLTV